MVLDVYRSVSRVPELHMVSVRDVVSPAPILKPRGVTLMCGISAESTVSVQGIDRGFACRIALCCTRNWKMFCPSDNPDRLKRSLVVLHAPGATSPETASTVTREPIATPRGMQLVRIRAQVEFAV